MIRHTIFFVHDNGLQIAAALGAGIVVCGLGRTRGMARRAQAVQ
ncbi:hypothetical protein Q4555_06655 [Octadecabacter sp. 1_MG-2023]|nr:MULTISPECIES: hypothetical protein [unclassified Octadecabacter]MDO6734341.1 hypothetical protein [Octadecabacter sp. 1_MG-2023]